MLPFTLKQLMTIMLMRWFWCVVIMKGELLCCDILGLLGSLGFKRLARAQWNKATDFHLIYCSTCDPLQRNTTSQQVCSGTFCFVTNSKWSRRQLFPVVLYFILSHCTCASPISASRNAGVSYGQCHTSRLRFCRTGLSKLCTNQLNHATTTFVLLYISLYHLQTVGQGFSLCVQWWVTN